MEREMCGQFALVHWSRWLIKCFPKQKQDGNLSHSQPSLFSWLDQHCVVWYFSVSALRVRVSGGWNPIPGYHLIESCCSLAVGLIFFLCPKLKEVSAVSAGLLCVKWLSTHPLSTRLQWLNYPINCCGMIERGAVRYQVSLSVVAMLLGHQVSVGTTVQRKICPTRELHW